jgi:hypothetical protein
MRLNCGNTLKPPRGARTFWGAGHIKRFRRSAVVHSQDRDESSLMPAGLQRCFQFLSHYGADVPVYTAHPEFLAAPTTPATRSRAT